VRHGLCDYFLLKFSYGHKVQEFITLFNTHIHSVRHSINLFSRILIFLKGIILISNKNILLDFNSWQCLCIILIVSREIDKEHFQKITQNTDVYIRIRVSLKIT